MSGRTIGHFEILEKLGEGGMGVVWKARDLRLDRTIALKLLPADRTPDPERKRRFVQEAKAASALNHPNIVTIHEIGEADGQDFIVMELVSGKPLDQLIPRKGLALEEALKFAIQIAGALAAAHGSGIIHRDLKPGNIMVTDAGTVKVLDFGLAKLTEKAEPSGDGATESMHQATGEGMILGTISYMSPEQAEGKKVDARSDIFSFGALLYEMLTGQRAFRGDSKVSVLAAILRGDPAPLSETAGGGVPRDMDKIVARCLRKEPDRRFQHMADVRVALEELQEEQPAQRAGKSRRATAMIAAAVAAILLVVAGAWWRWRGPVAAPAESMRTYPLTGSLNREIEPAFSPDGKQIAYASADTELGRFHIFVKLVGAGTPLQLTDRADDHDPAWSPDGRYIAFERLTGDQRDIYLIPSLGGPERHLSSMAVNRRSNKGLSWSADGKQLAAVAAAWDNNDGIVLLSAETGEQKMIAKPPHEYFGYTGPTFSPDGKWLAFTSKRSGRNHDVYIQPLATEGPPRRLTNDQRVIADLAWTPDSASIVLSSNRSGAPELWRIGLSGGAPERIAGIGDRATHPTICLQGQRLAYVQDASDLNIWRAALDGNHKAVNPARIVASTRDDSMARYSADARRVVFLSERSGSPEIWVADGDGNNPRMITSFGGSSLFGPRFSPDGRRIVFDMPVDGFRQVFTMGADGGPPRRLTNAATNLFNATWSRDGKWIYYFDTTVRPPQLAAIPSGGGAKVPRGQPGGALAMESPDGRYLYYSKRPGSGLWRMPLPSGTEEQVDEKAIEAGWDLAPDGVYLLRRGGLVEFLDYKTLKLSLVADNLGDEHHDVHEISVSSDGRWLLYTRHDRIESTIQVVEGFR